MLAKRILVGMGEARVEKRKVYEPGRQVYLYLVCQLVA